MPRHHVVLVPGFFGFESLGNLRYFAGVADTLTTSLRSRGIDAEIHELSTLPTASIRHRAATVLDYVGTIVDADPDPVHLIGHSTGGLDVRLCLAPTASLPSARSQLDVFERVQSVVTVSTPHLGTPLASFFAGTAGRPLLRIFALAMASLLENGHVPLRAALRLGRALTHVDDLLGLRNTTIDDVYRNLLADFGEERRDEVVAMLEQVASDQSLVFQLTPAAIDLLNSATGDPEGVRYGSVMTQARSPGLGSVRRIGRDIYAQGLHALFAALYKITGRVGRLPELLPSHRDALIRVYGELPPDHANDGIVPTLSQPWGEVIAGVRGDHLDVVGHFRGERVGASSDWLPSASGFGDNEFEHVWDAVAEFISHQGKWPRWEHRGLPKVR